MAHCEVEELTGCYGLVTESLPHIVVTKPPDQLTIFVLVQRSPELLQTLKSSGGLKTFLDGGWVSPVLLLLLAPGTPIHDTS